MFGTGANGTLPGRKYIQSQKSAFLGFLKIFGWERKGIADEG